MNEHSWAMQHLPWYTNGTLVGDEYARAHRHVNECLICQQELIQLRQISDAISTPIQFEGDAANALSEIMQQLPPQDKPAQTVSFSGNWWELLKLWFSNTPTGIKAALAVQSAALASAIFFLLSPINMGDTATENNYRTLSSLQNTSGDIRILFAPEVKLEQQQALLHSVDARIVDGPSPRGVYTLVVGPNQSASAAEKLRASKLVEFAQSLEGTD